MNPIENLSQFSLSYRNIIQIAKKVAAQDIPVLIQGENGTGKEWLARFIHFSSSRSDKDFVIVDCLGGAESLLEGELFGYVRGSFTGAIHDKKGLIESADGGSVLFDHIDGLHGSVQMKLVRIIQEGRFHKIGGISEIKSDIRVIATTERDLQVLVSKGKFRDDLYYLMNVLKITIPPLRERKDDVVILARYFMEDFIKKQGMSAKELTREVEEIFLSYDWPGNVRELKSEVERCVIMAGAASRIGVKYISTDLTSKKKTCGYSNAGKASAKSLKDQKKVVIAVLEKNAIREALKSTNGNRTKAAELLDISRQELIRKVNIYKIRS